MKFNLLIHCRWSHLQTVEATSVLLVAAVLEAQKSKSEGLPSMIGTSTPQVPAVLPWTGTRSTVPSPPFIPTGWTVTQTTSAVWEIVLWLLLVSGVVSVSRIRAMLGLFSKMWREMKEKRKMSSPDPTPSLMKGSFFTMTYVLVYLCSSVGFNLVLLTNSLLFSIRKSNQWTLSTRRGGSTFSLSLSKTVPMVKYTTLKMSTRASNLLSKR